MFFLYTKIIIFCSINRFTEKNFNGKCIACKTKMFGSLNTFYSTKNDEKERELLPAIVAEVGQ